MNRRRLIAINGLLLSVVVVTSTWGQTSGNQRKSLSQRMAELGSGWTQNDNSVPAEQLPTPQAEGGSLIPNWLSSGNQKKPNTATRQQQNQNNVQKSGTRPSPKRVGQPSANQSATQPRTATQPPVRAQGSSSPSGFTLPGLGGTKLPSTTGAASQSRVGGNSASNRYATSPQVDADYPVIRDVTPQGQSTTSPTNNSSRHSPARRTTPDADAQAFGRELAGSFSKSSAKARPAARTAQANERHATSGELAVDASVDSSDDRHQSTATDPALAAPVVEQAPQDASEPAANASPTATPDRFAPEGESSRSAVEAFGGSRTNRPTFGASEFIRTPRSNALPELPSAARSKEAFGEALQVAGGGDPSVLVSNQAPVISTDIRGPKQIMVGREAVYRVRLQNQSAANAEGIVGTIQIPASAEVVDATATQGTVQPSRNESQPTQLEWKLSNLDARGSEVLDIRLIPRESRPLELGVSWSIAPVGSLAIVEVQEPQLKIEIGGPTEVVFDKPQAFRLTLSNPGTGPAENVRIDLVPPGGTQETATSHTFGDLASGDSKSVEIELTAREAGKLTMRAIASAEGGLVADASKEIFCRKPELKVDWRGPARKYAGTPATYFFRVRNPGTAPAEDVTVQVTLPEDAEFTSASEGQQYDTERREVTWRAGTLNPGDDNYMELKCVVNAPGTNQFKITAATAAGNLTDNKVAETTVEAIADLKLSVSDPSGPVAVGSVAVYEIHVENSGASAARNVNVVALFSEGIEPDQAEGGTYTVADGRVSFQAIDELPAGGDVTLRIRARALQPGTHVFRAEVLCSDLEIKLAAEETTRFYADDVLPDSEEPSEQTSSRHGFESTAR
ncbi:MAG: hypothetical protein L0228_04390 [Planctomycetes bacterium]|nr:hypothetical protein [Planctomycetota bacterium]